MGGIRLGDVSEAKVDGRVVERGRNRKKGRVGNPVALLPLKR